MRATTQWPRRLLLNIKIHFWYVFIEYKDNVKITYCIHLWVRRTYHRSHHPSHSATARGYTVCCYTGIHRQHNQLSLRHQMGKKLKIVGFALTKLHWVKKDLLFEQKHFSSGDDDTETVADSRVTQVSSERKKNTAESWVDICSHGREILVPG